MLWERQSKREGDGDMVEKERLKIERDIIEKGRTAKERDEAHGVENVL